MKSKIINGDCIEEMAKLPENSIDAIVSDPPYGLAFMNKDWDKFSPKEFQDFSYHWGKEALRVLKPGGWLLAFSGTRTYHRMVCGLEDAGFEISNMILWMYGSGFPKSLDISKSIDKVPKIKYVTEFKKWLNIQIKNSEKTSKQINDECGFTATSYGRHDAKDGWAVNIPSKDKWIMMKKVINLSNDYDWIIEDNLEERGYLKTPTGNMHKGNGDSLRFKKEGKQLKNNPIDQMAKKWNGWGTQLKPAFEPIVMAQKPRKGTYAKNVLKWGVGGINIDGCRVENSVKDDYDLNERPISPKQSTERTVNIKADDPESIHGVKQKGRFPSNILLSHHSECKLIGVKKVGSGKAKNNSEIKRKGLSKKDPVFNSKTSGFTFDKLTSMGNYGIETIPAYKCHKDCPINILDKQSGEKQTSYRKNLIGTHYEKSFLNSMFKNGGTFSTSNQHNDKGGASRYFKQFEYQCHEDCPVKLIDDQSGKTKTTPNNNYKWNKTKCEGNTFEGRGTYTPRNDEGGASRYFKQFDSFIYNGKAYKTERNAGLEDLEHVDNTKMVNRKKDSPGIKNPRAGAGRGQGAKNDIATLKPVNVMRYLVRMVCPKGGIVLDPFAGSGTTGIACIVEGMKYILIEKRERFAKIVIPERLKFWKDPKNWKKLKKHNALVEPAPKPKTRGQKTLLNYPYNNKNNRSTVNEKKKNT